MNLSLIFSGENGDIAPSLVKILSDSQQEVPEFLSQFGQGGFSQGAFGGQDMRGGGAAPAAGGGDDEEWG